MIHVTILLLLLTFFGWTCAAFAAGPAGPASVPATPPAPLHPVVGTEEEVYRFTPADNGAGPLWCFGNTCIVRLGQQVFVSGIDTLPDYKPLNNVRWMLFQRSTDKGWQQVADGGDSHEREPCPLIGFDDGRLLLSTNPSSAKPDQYDAPAKPLVLQFDRFDAGKPSEYKTLVPKWNREIAFHGHTYRSFVADGPRHELILFYSTDYDKTYWTFCDSQGRFAAQGEIDFPYEKNDEKPGPVRVCYPVVQLKDRAVHYLGVSDIIEPKSAWRDHKKQLTGREWDYVFRRLYYTWSDDVTSGQFHPWVEVANVEETAGHLFPCDLWIAPDGRVHVLWSEEATDTRLREKFLPKAQQSRALNYAILRDGKVLVRQTIARWDEGGRGEDVGRGRFHVTADGRLLVFYYAGGKNWLAEMAEGGTIRPRMAVPLKQPMGMFFTATVRGGSAPSDVLDVLGAGETNQTMRYAAIRLR